METIVRGEFLLCCLFIKLFYASFCRRILFCLQLMRHSWMSSVLCCFVLFVSSSMSSRNVFDCGDYLQAKLKAEAERLNKAGVRLTQGYKKEDARMFFLSSQIISIFMPGFLLYVSTLWLHIWVLHGMLQSCKMWSALLAIHILINWLTSVGKQSRQVQLCTKVPPSSNKRFFGGNLLCSLVLSSLTILCSSWSELSSQSFMNYSLTC